MESIPLLLRKYPSELSVMETICKAIVQAALIQHGNNVPDSIGLDVTASLVGALSKVHWESQSIPFVRLASESVVRLLVLYDLGKNFYTILELVVSFVNTLFIRLESSPKSLTALGGSFPSDLPESVYVTLVEHHVHDKIINLVAMYADMSEADLSSMLSVLHRFAKAVPSSAYTYSLNSTAFLLLFAAQHFCRSNVVQDSLWKLLATIAKAHSEFTVEVTPDVLIPAVLPTISETTCNRTPVINFLNEYTSTHSSNKEPLLVISCLTEYPELLQVLLQLLDTSRELESQKQREEVAAVSNLLEMFFWKFRKRPTAKFIVQYHILDFLKQAAIKWPDLCCLSYCTAIRQYLNHLPPDLSSLQPSFRKYMERIPQESAEEKEIFFSENQFLPFVDLLCSPETFNSVETRSAIYDTIKFLLRSTPADMKNVWLTDEFLKSFITGLSKDVKAFRNKLHVFVFIGHFIVYTLEKSRMQLIRDQGWHEVAIDDCLKAADYGEARTTCLGFATCILHGYSRSLKDISPFSNSDFPRLIVDFAKEFGLGAKSEAGETFGSIILTLTADKQASIVLHKKGFLEHLYSLIGDQYDPQVIRPAVHAIGNIALSGHYVKQEVFDKDFHITLINYLRSNMSTADPSVLSACCRVLHILASGDWAKRKFAEEGLVEILMKMLDTRRDNEEVCWRPLGLLSSLGFMSLSNREYIMTEKVIESVLNLLKTTEYTKVKGYTALVFLASIDSDKRSADLQRMKVNEIFQQVLLNTGHCNTEDLHRWGSSLLEKGYLFTIPLNNGSLKLEEEQFLARCVAQSITWPQKPTVTSNPKESTDSTNTTLLLPLDESYLSPQFPEAPKLTDSAISQIVKLGLNPDNLFRIGRFFGSTHGLCSNCEKDGRSEELAFRPQSLTPNQYQELITRGWYRRGGVKLFRYRYNHNLDCSDWETRVLLSEFDHRKHKSYKKVLRKMPKDDRLTIETVPTQFISEAYDLYNSYHLVKHDKPLKSEYSYCEHVVNSPLCNQSVDGFKYGSFHQLYRLDGKLVAVGVIDVVPNGVVSVYMWYETSKEIAKFSFGVYSALKEIEYAKELSKRNPNIKYYYLQGWNGNNHKLSYKAKYEPEEFYSPCTVSSWVLGLDSVKKEQEKFKEKWLLSNSQGTDSSGDNPVQQNCVDSDAVDKTFVPGDALSLDYDNYKMETGLDKPDVEKIIVCLNHQVYLCLGDMLDTYSISAHQSKLIVERFEELVLAIGPQLSKNLVVDIMACGDLQEY